jgi:hypothetical protein
MLTSWDRDVVRHLLRLAFKCLLRRLTGETDPRLRERLAFAGNAVRDAARWLVQGADPAMILFSLNEVSIEEWSPEADSHIEAIRFTCRKAIAIERRKTRAFQLLALKRAVAHKALASDPASAGKHLRELQEADESLTERLG